MKQKNKLTINKQKGFTLVEILAVLVILGILSAFSVTNYMDLQNQARIKSGQAAIAKTKIRLASGYVQYLLANKGVAPDNIAAICNLVNDASILPISGNGNVPLGNDYTATLKDNGFITITMVNGVATNAIIGTWAMP